ncbi:Murein L,D-transpeptidase YcbB/YkuD [Pseudoxanthobacter soli DSM 19599]|uniref:Murein L,D-transpeptidase YcbB/YkuD n=1 Tax=Pseudoxanthobacter soli DSM 19599 TaxID=1123029 RepID=A0A1M7Z5Q2_9HYPH|nr:L,D-transpeptidase family protein [Pseudoxanthobacter soli]SHO60263.1 Murein L,D-transpeptidase YcbB/YkuD [Pseudoxanthobacter soli DSM 19599]
MIKDSAVARGSVRLAQRLRSLVSGERTGVESDAPASVSRRNMLTLMGGGAVGAFVTGPAMAQSAYEAAMSSGSGAEWADKFDAPMPSLQSVKSNRPTFSPQSAAYTEQAIQAYTAIVQKGGWPTLPTNMNRLKVGSRGPNVVTLRQRLLVTGDLVQNSGRQDTFDSYVDAAVRRFQIRNGLQPDGVVGGSTLKALNVPADVRLQQLQVNLVRLKAMSGDLGQRYVMVNIPGAEIEAVENGLVASRHLAVVGKIDRQSPILTSKISQINFNPYWHVPVSIIRKDLIPKMQADPNYLTRNKIHIYDGKGRELQATDIDWNTNDAVNYQFRQEPGLDNSMGSVKINFANPYSVYMHDTPSKSLFGQDARFHSSGCVRVQNVRQLIGWLLKTNPEWPEQKIDQVIRDGTRVDAQVKPPVPLYFTYVTAWATPEGVVNFRSDIYMRDGLGTVTITDGDVPPDQTASAAAPTTQQSASAAPAYSQAPAQTAPTQVTTTETFGGTQPSAGFQGNSSSFAGYKPSPAYGDGGAGQAY